MKISYNWLKEYLDFDKSAEETAVLLTDCGLEVEALEKVESHPGGLKGLLVGKVVECSKHPNADKLKLTKVDVGSGELLNIVCGAPNVAVNQKVIVATIGTSLYPSKGESYKIKKSKIRGEVSEGMICAEDEIGTGESHEGILILPNDTPVGLPASEYFNVSTDWVFEIGLTPNRSDAASHFGVARDLSAVLALEKQLNLQRPDVSGFKIDEKSIEIAVEVRNTEACPRYSAICIKDVEIKASPSWLANKLRSIGIKPINNIVDVTNFVLHEIGQPLHAFDADRIKGGKVIIQNLPADTEFVSLEGAKRKLHSDDLMICNAEEGMCIAGVFGGLDSGVKNETVNVFLESAYFDPSSIRKTAKRHNLSTDASFRYERGADPEITVYALKRAAQLIKQVAGGTIASEIVDIYPNKIAEAEIDFSYASCDRMVGQEINRQIIKLILEQLGIKILKGNTEGLKVSVPAFKNDVRREIDLVEEILRIYGYNKIESPHFLKTSLSYTQDIQSEQVKNSISAFLASNGFFEIFNNSLSSPKYYTESDNAVHLLNPLSSELSMMRQSLLYGGLEALEHNINRKRGNLQFFEFGKTYFKLEGKYSEKQKLGLWLQGSNAEDNWRKESTPHDFYSLKKVVEALLLRLGIDSSTIKGAESEDSTLLYGLGYSSRKKPIVDFGEVKSDLLAKNGIETAVFYADFHWDNILSLLSKGNIQFEPVAKFPSVRRDLALLIDKKVKFKELKELALKLGNQLLHEVELFDVYEGKNLPEGKKSYALSFTFQDREKTLTDKRVEQAMDALIAKFKEELGAQLR